METTLITKIPTVITKVEIKPVTDIHLNPLNVGFSMDYLNKVPKEIADADYLKTLYNHQQSSLGLIG